MMNIPGGYLNQPQQQQQAYYGFQDMATPQMSPYEVRYQVMNGPRPGQSTPLMMVYPSQQNPRPQRQIMPSGQSNQQVLMLTATDQPRYQIGQPIPNTNTTMDAKQPFALQGYQSIPTGQQIMPRGGNNNNVLQPVNYQLASTPMSNQQTMPGQPVFVKCGSESYKQINSNELTNPIYLPANMAIGQSICFEGKEPISFKRIA